MGERETTVITEEPLDEFFEQALEELNDDELSPFVLTDTATEKALKAAKRRQAEKRLEILRLREELGDYDLDYDLD
jgi:hypothetical protein